MAQLYKCESCKRFTEKKCLGKDGICFLIPKKPNYVNKNQWCKHWLGRKSGLDAGHTLKQKKGEESCS